MKNLSESTRNLLAFSLMIVVGVGLIVYGIIVNNRQNHFLEVYEETTGTVYDYYTSHDDGDETYTPKYRYEVGGETYTVRGYRDYHIKPRDGETDTIYYDPENPEYARTRLHNSGPGTIGIGVVLTIVGVFVEYTLLKARRKD